MKSSTKPIHCPSCSGALQPRLLECKDCDLRVEGRFQLNEFASLGEEDLHFLRIFIHAEGRVRDMESALGLSYPTIRSRLSGLKARLVGTPIAANKVREAETEIETAASPKKTLSTQEILERLEAKEVSYPEAFALIKKGKIK